MNQDINNQLFNENNIVNEPNIEMPNISVQEPTSEPVQTEEVVQEAPKSKVIVLDEDPVKFVVQDVESPVTSTPETVEEPTTTTPTEQTGNIQF